MQYPTIFEFMKNPTITDGKTAFRNIVRDKHLKSRYTDYIKVIGTLKFIPYFKDEHKYLFHFKIPSASTKNVMYDVCIEFFSNEPSIVAQNTIEQYSIRIFSNSPDFTFTYAQVCYLKDFLVPELIDKFDGNILEESPGKRNPTKAIGFDYPLFFCMYFLSLNKFYLKKNDIIRRGKSLSSFDTDDVLGCYETLRLHNGLSEYSIKELGSSLKRKFNNVTRPIRNLTGPRNSETVKGKPNKTVKAGIIKPKKPRSANSATTSVKTAKTTKIIGKKR